MNDREIKYQKQCETSGLKIYPKNMAKLNLYSQNPEKYIECANKTKYQIKPGTQFVKNYKGQNYMVIAKSEDCFIYDGNEYKNLSAVAKVICGLKVSGNDFFGLNNKKKS
jgi:hypothetical protein